MDAVKFLKEKSRMCESDVTCADCPIYKAGGDGFCSLWMNKHPEKAVAIVEKWSEEHPQKTILDEFIEKYPNAQISDKGVPKMCPYDLGYGDSCPDIIRFDCVTCWNRPLSEVK